MTTAFARGLRAEMAAGADPQRAVGMQRYMKSTMPYYGLYSAAMRAACKKVFAAHPFTSCSDWQAAVLELWRDARYREERYAAIELVYQGAPCARPALKRHRGCWSPALMPVLEEMIVTGAWWDYVDGLARVVGELLRSHPKQMRPLMRRWSRDPDLWKRRVSIICQLSFKRDTDLDLLYGNIEPNLSDRDFFIRKAVGWALRQYAWTDPKEVRRYVREHEKELSGLSRREALKNIG